MLADCMRGRRRERQWVMLDLGGVEKKPPKPKRGALQERGGVGPAVYRHTHALLGLAILRAPSTLSSRMDDGDSE